MRNQELIAKAYFKLLNAIDWKDEVLLMGIREGLNKFVSNVSIRLSGKSKYLQGDYYSLDAKKKVDSGDLKGLIYEHMVPKKEYIQNPCEEQSRRGRLTENFIIELFDKYWKIAVITKEEDKRLSRSKMPDNWDNQNVFVRYEKAGVKLTTIPD